MDNFRTLAARHVVRALAAAALALSAFAVHAPAWAERIKELASIQGVRQNQLIGYGLVVGLDGSGDMTTQTPFTVQSLNSMLSQLGIQLPRSTREMITLDAPKVARSELEPGDIIFFNNRGRGRVSHAGIYQGDNQFIHSSSSRSGGVRVDSLADRYWNSSYMLAKRVLDENHLPATSAGPQHR